MSSLEHHFGVSGSRSRPARLKGCPWGCLVRLAILSLVSIVGVSCVFAQGRIRKNILVITEVSETHPAIAMVMREIREGFERNPKYEVEIYVESLDTSDFSNAVVERNIRDEIRKYQEIQLDVIVAVGPTPINILATSPEPLLPNVPVVFCCAIFEMAGSPKLDSRFTGSWLSPDPAATLDVALRLFPNSKHVVLVAGSSAYDRAKLAVIRTDLQAYQPRMDFIELTGLEMPVLLSRLHHLPPHSVVLFISMTETIVNAKPALPSVAGAANAPVFVMNDSHLGQGVIGGKLMSFQDQGRIAAGLISKLLAGKKPQDLPMTTAPNAYIFDWRELRRWHVDDKLLPPGSRLLFRETTFPERHSHGIIVAAMLAFILLVLFLYSRKGKQLRFARHEQSELSGLLIGAQEQERGRVARELHDDFSQRLALLTFGLEAVAETIPKSPAEADRQVHDLLNSTSEISQDLHTLSHRLHSSTLENLGLVHGVAALCREFQAQQGLKVDFEHGEIQRSIDPDTALCIFRIVQEALRNVKKHSGADQTDVKLEIVENKAHVSVLDHGKGFDRGRMLQSGLGLRSMEERTHMLGGAFQVRSRPGQGTRVEAWVPLQPKHPNHESHSAH
jgi:signal transduction histidine kinase